MNPENNGQMSKNIDLTPAFKLVFITICIFTGFAFIILLFISTQEPPNPAQTRLFNTCDTILKMGFGAMVGLISGKSI